MRMNLTRVALGLLFLARVLRGAELTPEPWPREFTTPKGNTAVMYQPCSAASSLACFTIPDARFAAGLRITFAPSPFMSLRRSTENESAMIATNG